MPLAHVSLPVTDLAAATNFYLAALKPLGYTTFMKLDSTIGMNVKYAGPDFWLHQCPEATKKGEGVSKTHVAFVGNSKKAVHAFYEAALKAGGKDNGKPGERDYTKGYYAAYVLDLDGNNIECLYYQPLWLSAIQAAPSVVGAVVVAGVAWWGGKQGWGL